MRIRIQLVNKGMRLLGVTDEMIGQYVLADDWNVQSVIGPGFKARLLTARAKAITVDYVNKEMATVYDDVKSTAFQEIVTKSVKYDKDWGYYWGLDFTVRYNDNEYDWFLCTQAVRELAMLMAKNLDKDMFVTSELVDARRFKFYKPTVGFKK